jgi:hypothetical protein
MTEPVARFRLSTGVAKPMIGDSALRRQQNPWYKGRASKAISEKVSAIHSIQPIAPVVTISRRIPR